MVGILVIVLISGILLLIIEKKSLLVLGFLPIIKRLRQFFIGFLIAAIICALVQYLESLLKSSEWILNQHITVVTGLKATWWDIKSVFTEELIFRGALLYILIQKVGSQKGMLLSAIGFGIYHWFSFGVMGNGIAMVLVFLGTGLMGYALAWAFVKTRSIMLPFGIHLGWNVVHNTLFSKGPLGDLILITQGVTELSDWVALLIFVFGMIVAPIFFILYIKFFVNNENGHIVKVE